MYTVARVSPCGRGERRTRRDGERTVGEGVDLRVLAPVAVDPAEARQRILAVDVHGARTADALAARAAERERRVELVLDLDERVKNLYAAAERRMSILYTNWPGGGGGRQRRSPWARTGSGRWCTTAGSASATARPGSGSHTHSEHGRTRAGRRRTTHPAVDLELLVQDGLLQRRRLRARGRGGEAPRGLPEHARAGCDERLHRGRRRGGGRRGGGGGKGERGRRHT